MLRPELASFQVQMKDTGENSVLDLMKELNFYHVHIFRFVFFTKAIITLSNMAAYYFIVWLSQICLNKSLLMTIWDVSNCFAIAKSSTLDILVLQFVHLSDYFLTIYYCNWRCRVKEYGHFKQCILSNIPEENLHHFDIPLP